MRRFMANSISNQDRYSQMVEDGYAEPEFEELFLEEKRWIAISCDCFERGLNVLGYMPIVSKVSSMIRGMFAIAEIVFGIALGILSNLIFIAQDNEEKHAPFYYTYHGLLNIPRAFIESFPFAGNFLCLIYDYKGYRIGY